MQSDATPHKFVGQIQASLHAAATSADSDLTTYLTRTPLQTGPQLSE